MPERVALRARAGLAAAIGLLLLAVGCTRLDNLFDNPKGWAGRRVCLLGRSCGPPGPHFGAGDWLEACEPQTYELLVADGSSAERIDVMTSGPLPKEGNRVLVYGVVRARPYVISPLIGECLTVSGPVIEDPPEMKALYAAARFCAQAVRGPRSRQRRASVRGSFPHPGSH